MCLDQGGEHEDVSKHTGGRWGLGVYAMCPPRRGGCGDVLGVFCERLLVTGVWEDGVG